MTINTAWKIEIGGTTPTNFTSRVMGASINQFVDVNTVGQGTCTVTLLNKDGALTPGGGGTYSNTDWFQQAMRVSVLTNTGGANTETLVFNGAVTDFDLMDDGVYSTVTISALDFLTFAGRTTAPTTGVSGNQSYTGRLTTWVGTSLGLPNYGASTISTTLTNLSSENPTCNRANAVYATLADAIQIGTVPVANDVVWHDGMVIYNAATIGYTVNCIPSTNTRTTATRIDFEFSPVNLLSGSKLPFDDTSFKQAYNLPTLVTNAQCQGAFAGSTLQTSQSSNLSVYGYRTQTFTNAEFETDTAALQMAQKLTNRYGTARFTPESMSISASLVKRLAADAAHSKWYALLSLTNGFWQKATVTWTGSGASSQTADCVIKGRQINITPDDAVVTLTLGNWVDNHAFILDTDKLDTDRLG